MINLRNHSTGEQEVDRFHRKASTIQKINCKHGVCLGSTYGVGGKGNEVGPASRPAVEVEFQAQEFLCEYYESIGKLNSAEYESRWQQVKREITETNGTYELTEEELSYGVKLAWINAPRCVGRIQWRNIKVFDERKITTAKEMFDAICRHITYTTNGGNIRSAITVFPMREPGKPDFRIWNTSLLGYAGYRNPDGTILGHSVNAEFTDVCLKLGWKCPDIKTKQDVLPVFISAPGCDPELFILPPEIVMQVKLEHPEFAWFKEFDLRWFSFPFLAGMLFDCGGLQFPAAPFSGWFTCPEIASRDLGDTNRYNCLPEFATKMGLNTEHSTSLWKDKAMVELNIAVLHSYRKAGVTIIDHHTAAEQFMTFFKTEQLERGGCPADWAWIVHPISGSTLPVFHQEMALYFIKPSFEYQTPAWKVHVWKNKNQLTRNEGDIGIRRTFRQVAFAVIFSSSLFQPRINNRIKATILYASETGKAEAFANRLQKVLSNSFNPRVIRMDTYDLPNLHQESMIIVITSTFGNGDPPANGESFSKHICTMKLEFLEKNMDKNYQPLKHSKFAVFALGSSAYPNLCAFGRNLDYNFKLLGGQQLISPPCGDELKGQEAAFRKWSGDVYQAACDAYFLKAEILEQEKPMSSLTNVRFRFRESPNRTGDFNLQTYKSLHGSRKFEFYNLVQREDLHKPLDDAKTIRCVLEVPIGEEPLHYRVGDHIGIIPQNRKHLVTSLLPTLKNKPKIEDMPVELESKCSNLEEWKINHKLPRCSVRQLLENVLDFVSPPTQEILLYLQSIATEDDEKEELLKLAKDFEKYDAWKEYHRPNLVTVLNMFPSCSPDAAMICSMLPIIQPRYYSISSSSKVHNNQLHLTVGVVRFKTQNGSGKINLGVCSNYLNELELGARVACFVRNTSSGTFRLPEDCSQPIILIGPGTGIAPFRGFWQERKLIQQQGNSRGKLTLFFGCRTKEMRLYAEEVDELEREGVVTKYLVAFSREKNIQKKYVQDLILEHREEVVKQIIDENAVTYICGDAAMGEDVILTLQKLMQDAKKLSDEGASEFIKSLKESDRCHMDIFGQSHKRHRVKS